MSRAPQLSADEAIRRAVLTGIDRWRDAGRSVEARSSRSGVPAKGPGGTLGSLPRRRFVAASIGEVAPPPQMRRATFRLSYARALARLFLLSNVLVEAAAAIVWDQLTRRNTASRRASHLRRTFERMGGTFVTIGQRFALRLDLMKSQYGDELSRMRDRIAPFPVQEAVAAIERATGKPLPETFEQFDPVPVVSTSIACVYQAVLRNGEKVVAKVRRPGVGELFVADLKVFDWISRVMEFFTILRPGRTGDLRRELTQTLLDELDFVREARHQDVFRRTAKKSGKSFFTAPRVHFELSGEDVIVQEFVSGMWLWELIAAVEQNDHKVLALAAQLNIDPRRVARRILWVSFWSWRENLFFVAEPHQDNIILGRNGTVTFIDFTSTGAMDPTKRRALQQNLYHASKRDPLNMARASVTLLEPLPPVDVAALTKDLEALNWHVLYAFESEGMRRAWHERTTRQQWLGLMHVARRYGIVIDFDVLRLLRAEIMHEALAVRLDESIDILDEYERFTRDRASHAVGRMAERLVGRAARPSGNALYLKIEELAGTSEALFFRMRHLLALPRVNFSSMMGKGSHSFVMMSRFIVQTLILTGVATYATVLVGRVLGYDVTYRTALVSVGSARLYQAAVAFLLFVNARSMIFRLEDKDV